MNYDVAVVGAGVIGSLIARDLSRYNIKLPLSRMQRYGNGHFKSQQRYRSRRFRCEARHLKHAST